MPEHAGSWLVSSAHRKMREEGGVRQWGPYFERHARQLGSITTACGLLASNWHVFHDVWSSGPMTSERVGTASRW